MQPSRSLAALVLSLTLGGCAHLLQPETYKPHQRVDLQKREYLEKELVHGLSEETFLRWYTRTPAWTDPLRPSVESKAGAGEETTYRVTGGAGLVGTVAFRDGRLDHWTTMELMQESVVSVWQERNPRGREVDADALARIERLDPASDALNAAAPPDRPKICSFASGDAIENTRPLEVDPRRGNLVLGAFNREADEAKAAPDRVLPAGTRLTVEAWDPVHGRRFRDGEGKHYTITDSLLLRPREGLFCPPGVCPRPGQLMRTTRDLELGASDDPATPSLAVLDRRTRIPVWMPRTPLPAGSRVVVKSWDLCEGMRATMLREGDADTPGRVISVPFAPPGLFAPVDRAPADDAARGVSAPAR